MICTFYSHYIGFEKIVGVIQQFFPKGILTYDNQEESQIVTVEIKGGFLSSSKKLKITYRQRKVPSYFIPEVDDSSLTANLKGLYGFVDSLPTTNEKVKSLFLEKILTLNCEFSLMQEQGEIKELKYFIEMIADEFDAIIFAQPQTLISKSQGQHFLDKNLNLIIDGQGGCEIDHLDVRIESIYIDGDQSKVTQEQIQRKEKSESLIQQHQITINPNLPCIESEKETTLRAPQEIAQRVTVLAVINMVAFDTISSDEAVDYLQNYNIWDLVTPKEKEFLANPTEDQKIQETWKCECIWTLMWALEKVDNLGFPNELCDLKNINPAEYPIGQEKNPNHFITSISASRSTDEILNANDLYYRLDWACVEARVKNLQMTRLNPSVVYERHYALNWLIRYMNQEWDDVSCDT